MKRSEIWKIIWTPIKKRIPPFTDDIVLCWNPIAKAGFTQYSYIAHEHAKELLKGNQEHFSSDRIFNKWCKPQG